MINLPAAKRYSKRDLCYLLVDTSVNLDNPGNAKCITTPTLKEWVKKKNLFTELGLTEREYDALKSFSPRQSEVIIGAFC